jgi:pimeloyl-ACP methyl ester carboxylesterase
MGAYVEIGGLKIWYDELGEGEPLVLLHGGLVTNDTWGPQMGEFGARFHVLAPERRAHGHTPDVEGPLSYDHMAADTIGFLETVVGGPAHLVGWSDGGNVGLLVAIARPDLVRKLVAISANFNTTGTSPEAAAALESMTPDSEDTAMFRQMYEAASPDGPEHWPIVFGKLMEMWTTQPNIAEADLARISSPTLVVAGDDDVISIEHTTTLYRAIPNAELAVVPGTSHVLTMEKPELVNRIILDFIEKDPVPTMMPVRRAPEGGHPSAG